jgi:hypothetical protein
MYCILLSIAKPRTVFGVLLSKPSFIRLILALYNFMVLFKIFVQWLFDYYISTKAKALFDELAAIGPPISLRDFNLYVFRGLRSEFKGLVTSLVTKEKPLSYADLHSHLSTNEFIHKTSL